MATYTISAEDAYAVKFAPSTEIEEILQNVRVLLHTIKHSVPLDRELGVDYGFIDAPSPAATAQLRAGIVDAISYGEPRARVRLVRFERRESEAMAGTFYPVVEIGIKE